MAKETKYIFVTGGVLSGLGKGITAASIANLLKARGLHVNLQKCDPYLNVDAGMLNPREHGECFVTKDGAETDLDLGHYERFLDEELTKDSSLMQGRVLMKVIDDERNGKYQGQTVQIVPHVMNAIQHFIREAGKDFDVHIVEIGGTVGDMESQSFTEAIREFGLRAGRDNCLYVHVVYLPYLGASNETKTKPAQNAVRELRGMGIMPDVLVARSEKPAGAHAIHKLSMFSGVEEEAIVLLPNAASIYEVPLTLEDTGIANVICRKLGVKSKRPNLKPWREMVDRSMKKYGRTVRVGIVAKYLDNEDTYLCVFEALRAASWWSETNVDIVWVDAEGLGEKQDITEDMKDLDGIVITGGFGSRGVEGKIKAAQYAMKHSLPCLGLCYGLHMILIAAARNAGLEGANTTEVDPDSKYPVIATMEDQKGKENTGGTMRLGDYPCELVKGSMVAKLYDAKHVVERHRHRYECNNDYRDQYESWGIRASGLSPDGHLVEIIEGINHPFLLASQFHPELKSRPNRPHPIFKGFIEQLIK
ncbi:MAG TPA: CTP synthase [Patescibacteria group bacterium]|nr:CTP synthase [Patescibacteria group bacterium]